MSDVANFLEREKMSNLVRKENGLVDFDAYKGIAGTIEVGEMTVSIVVIDARLSFGRLDLCVMPTSGSGFRWIDQKNVTLGVDPITRATPVVPKMTIREQIALRQAENLSI